MQSTLNKRYRLSSREIVPLRADSRLSKSISQREAALVKSVWACLMKDSRFKSLLLIKRQLYYLQKGAPIAPANVPRTLPD